MCPVSFRLLREPCKWLGKHSGSLMELCKCIPLSQNNQIFYDAQFDQLYEYAETPLPVPFPALPTPVKLTQYTNACIHQKYACIHLCIHTNACTYKLEYAQRVLILQELHQHFVEILLCDLKLSWSGCGGIEILILLLAMQNGSASLKNNFPITCKIRHTLIHTTQQSHF